MLKLNWWANCLINAASPELVFGFTISFPLSVKAVLNKLTNYSNSWICFFYVSFSISNDVIKLAIISPFFSYSSFSCSCNSICYSSCFIYSFAYFSWSKVLYFWCGYCPPVLPLPTYEYWLMLWLLFLYYPNEDY